MFYTYVTAKKYGLGYHKSEQGLQLDYVMR